MIGCNHDQEILESEW